MPERIKMKKKVVGTTLFPNFDLTHPSALNKIDIAKVMYESYKDTIDYENDTIDDLVMDILNIESGLYGKYLDDASFIAIKDGEIIGGIFITDFKGEATITYNFTDRKYRNQGVSTTLIQYVENELYDKGYEDIHIYLSLENQAAYNLYQSVGFEKEHMKTQII